MKKSNLSSKSKHFDIANFGYGKGVIIIILVLAFFGIFTNTVGTDPLYTLKENYDYFSAQEYGYCFSNFYYIEYYFILFVAGILGLNSFTFLNNKQYGITLLSLPLKRKKLFNQKVILPVVGLSLIVIFVKLLMLHYNIKIFGVKNELIIQAVTDIFICLKYVFFGFTAFAISSVACGKKLETVLGGASIVFVLPTLYSLIDSLLDSFLYGYDSYSNVLLEDINEFVFILDPLHEFSLALFLYEDMRLTREKLVMSVLWLALSIVALVFTKRYFVEKYRAEKIEMKATNKPMLVLVSVVASIFATQLILSFVFDWYFYLNDIPNSISHTVYVLIYFILMIVFAYLTMSLVETSFKLNKNKIIAVVSPLAVIGLVLVFTSTGGLGYEKRVPDVKDIKSVEVFTSFYGSNMLNSMDSRDIFTTTEEMYTFYTENDFKVVTAIHEEIIENQDMDTYETFSVTYTLKNGDVFTRDYINLSEEAAAKLIMLWKTDASKKEIEAYLLGNKPTNTNIDTEISDLSRAYYDYEVSSYYEDAPYSVFNYDQNVIFIASKQNTETMVNDKITKEEFDKIKQAIYKDYCELTAEEWFKPTKTLGAIALTYAGGYYYDYYGYEDEKEAEEESTLWGGFIGVNEQVTIPVTAEMKNTVAVLKGLGLYQYLNDSKVKIGAMYIADANEYFDWKAETYGESYYYGLYEQSVYFLPDYELEYDIPYFADGGKSSSANPLNNNFGDDDYEEYYNLTIGDYDYSTAPVTEVKDTEEIAKLLDKAHICYYDEAYKGQILFVDYAGGVVDAAYYIP